MIKSVAPAADAFSNRMKPAFHRIGTLLAINLLYLMVWGFTGLGKVQSGVPSWLGEKFGATILARFPGLTASFWLLATAELLAFALALVALLRAEFLGRRSPTWLTTMLVWSVFVFIQLGFGQWLTAEHNDTFQLFAYFGITLVALLFVAPASFRPPGPPTLTYIQRIDSHAFIPSTPEPS
jgi:hypothetical protein